MNGKKFEFPKVLSAIAMFTIISTPVLMSATPPKDKSKPTTESGTPLFEIGNSKFYYEELNRVFKKNFNRQSKELNSISCDSIKDFIELYSSYRLKIMDAEARGLEKEESVRKELDNNRKIVTDSYYYDKVLINPNADKLAQRRTEEKKFAYIMVAFPPAPNMDTTMVFSRAKGALDLIKAGKPFGEIAREFSDDKTSGENGGVIDEFITAGKMDRILEDELYSLKPGEISKNVIKLPRFGYFIVKLLKSEKREFAKFRHILISNSLPDSNSTINKSMALIEDIQKKLSAGADFATLAQEYSEDASSAKSGGLIDDWYSRSTGFAKSGGKVVPEFEDAVFKLKPGETSNILNTKYGYHIIRLDSIKPVDIKNEHDEMKQIYRRLYLEIDKQEHLEGLKKEYGYKLYQDIFDRLIASLDTNQTNLDSNWTKHIDKDLQTKTLYTFDNKTVKVSDLIAEMQKPGEIRGLPTNPEGINRVIRYLTNPIVIRKATENLESTNAEFRELVNEFREGTLLFKAESAEVWNKMQFDSTEARKYFEANRDKYFTPITYDLQEILVINKKDADELYTKIKNKEIEFDEAARKFTQRASFRESAGTLIQINPKVHKIAELVQKLGTKEGEFCEPQPSDNGFSIIKVNKINYPKQKTYEESISEIAPMIQEKTQKKLLKEWIENLKIKYNYKANTREINKLCK